MWLDRYTDRARNVMGYARREAERFNYDLIGTEHILLGLVKEGSGLAANVLGNLGIDLERLGVEVKKRVKKGSSESRQQLLFTTRAQKAVEYALDEERHLGHKYTGTEHLLLGLLREKEGTAAEVLTSLGVKLDDARREVMELLGTEAGPKPDGESIPLNPRVSRVLEYAREEARREGSPSVDVAHLGRGVARLEGEESS